MTQRTDPLLWEVVKGLITAADTAGTKPGQWSARKAVEAVKLYKELGGRYKGKKGDNSLTQWLRQDWRTKSGKPSSETGERYLPAKAIEALTPQEQAATTRAKRMGSQKGEQFVPQPAKIAQKTARFR